MEENRKKALSAALGQIEKQFGKGSVMRLGDAPATWDVEAVSTGSLGLDVALGIGGLPRGRIVEIYGPESSGKTTLTLQVVAEVQKAGGTAAFVNRFRREPLPAGAAIGFLEYDWSLNDAGAAGDAGQAAPAEASGKRIEKSEPNPTPGS